jgi:beta-phosphoglucomutase-like phosphatase (HAD superfamily)
MHIILFDIDGTLVNSNGFDGRLYIEAVREILGIEIDDDWSRYKHVTDGGVLEELLDGIGYDADRTPVRAAVESDLIRRVEVYLSGRDRSLPEVPGARRFVEMLSALPGVSVGFATGGWQVSAIMKLRAIGLQPDITCMASGSDADRRTDIMALAERRLSKGQSVSRRTYFGDGPWDKDASAQLGFDFIAIGDGVDHDVRFSDFRSAEEILGELGIDGSRIGKRH